MNPRPETLTLTDDIRYRVEVVIDDEAQVMDHANALASVVDDSPRFKKYCHSYNEIAAVTLMVVDEEGTETVRQKYERPADGAPSDPDSPAKKYASYAADPPSEAFIEAVLGDVSSASPGIRCEHCQRMHYGEGIKTVSQAAEYEEANEAAALDPNGHLFHEGFELVRWGMLRGKPAVVGCPCNVMTVFERSVHELRAVAVRYYKRDTVALMAEAERRRDELTDIDEAEPTVTCPGSQELVRTMKPSLTDGHDVVQCPECRGWVFCQEGRAKVNDPVPWHLPDYLRVRSSPESPIQGD